MPKDYKKRYKQIGESEWFKEAYKDKSVGEVLEITEKTTDNELIETWQNFVHSIIDNQITLDKEISDFVEENFWELI